MAADSKLPLKLSLQIQTCAHNDRWNEQRKTKTLGWKTPWQTVIDAYVRSWAYLNYMHDRFKGISECTHSEIDQGRRDPCAENGSASAAVAKSRPKRLTYLDRYLQYVDWEDKQRLKMLIPVVAMSQISSVQK